ncbi:MAG: hypothetical protein KJN89_12475 [Gammaproteobacteria bacterium]|nr:hypothetical protein [Gammaproteobacteria bacterium]MBT8133845.1 hypothetical protein [Gammaproteobacteria bacterium]NNJ51181.1 hypothetical protein [Gammaproteobacteria bacterium]
MKNILLALILGSPLLAAGCNSNPAKESGTDSSEQSAPTPSRSGRY